jgi:hypothetical protein
MRGRWTLLQRELLKLVGAQLKEHGFSPRLSDQSFNKKVPLGLTTFHLAFIPHGEQDFDITADVALRLDEVEELTRPGAKTYTVGGEIGNLSIGRQRRWKVASETDLAGVVSEVVEAFKVTGFHFLARFPTLRHTYSILAKNDFEAILYSPLDDVRWRSVIALAWLLGRREEVDRLIAEGEAFLRGNDHPSVSRFTDFASKLRSLPPR